MRVASVARRHDAEGEHDRDRQHGRRYQRRRRRPSPPWYVYRDDDSFIYVHSGRYGPCWYNGHWHPYRADRPRVIYYGYWIDTDDYYYVHRLEPPWAEDDYRQPPTPERVPDYEPDEVYGDFILKGEIHDALIVKELVLSTIEARRFRILVRRGVIAGVLEQGSQRRESDYGFDERRGELTLTAPSEQVAIIETMVGDQRTFELITEPNRYGYTAVVIPLVSPLYLEQDFRGATALAGDNFNALRRTLEDRDVRYSYREKACWHNAEYGTATVFDDDEGIERALALMERRPFVPREMVHE